MLPHELAGEVEDIRNDYNDSIQMNTIKVV